VFDRKADYDPRVDPIVRVEARRLRDKLDSYYEADGRNDDVLICFEKGTYVPVFRRRRDEPAPAPAPKQAPGPRTVAVLPLADLTPGGGNQYFSDGLTEELIHALTRVSDLRVVAWNSSAQFRGEKPDLRAVAEQLQVSNVLTGSVRMAGRQLRVRAQLIEAASGAYLWSETYDREVSDIFAIQEEIAHAIVRTLRVELTVRAEGRSTSRSGADIDAYELYLKGRYHWNMRTSAGLFRSVRFFEAAISLEEGFALAHAGLADAYNLLADFNLMSPMEAMPKARAAAQRAIELEPGLAEAWTSLAFIRSLYDWEWKEAGELYRRAIELNPGYATAHFWYAVDYLAMLGRHDEAMVSMNRAIELDPLTTALRHGKGSLYTFRGEYDTAVEYFLDLVERYPENHRPWSALGRAWERKGRYDNAIECLEKARANGGDLPNVVSALGQVHAAAGHVDEARQMLAKLHALTAERVVHSSGFAMIHMALGETEKALDWLESGCDRHELSLCSLRVHPLYDSLRGEPRFQAIVRRMWGDF
jgi:serine/threonine-protein kinase